MAQPTTETKNSDHKSNETSGWRELASTGGILFAALLTAFFIINFVFRSYQVDGQSMETTLQDADKLIIWKVPRSWARITSHAYIPQRGDVVVFDQSGLSEYGQADNKQLIKRVIGLPGDRVTIKDGSYIVYNDQYPGGFNPDSTQPYGEKLAKGITNGNTDVTLGENQIFVSGDNRTNSLDSRNFGPINASQLVGKLVLRAFPIGNAEAF